MRLNANTPITNNIGLTKIPVFLIYNRAYTDTRPRSLQSRAHTATRSLYHDRAHTDTRSLYNRAHTDTRFF